VLYDVDIEASSCVLSSRYAMLCYTSACMQTMLQQQVSKTDILTVDYEAKYEEASATALSANPAVAEPLLTVNGWILMRKVMGSSVTRSGRSTVTGVTGSAYRRAEFTRG